MVMDEAWLNRIDWKKEVIGTVRRACPGLSHQDIDDISQMVALGILLRLRSQKPLPIESSNEIASYIFVSARNCKNSWLRDESRERQKALGSEPGKMTRRSDEWTRDEILGELSHEQREMILNFLPDDKRKLRDVLRLRFKNLKRSEIGKILGVSEPTISRRLELVWKFVKPRISEIFGGEQD
jgi:RNA polymerase sigma factor (sigma-70 family)